MNGKSIFKDLVGGASSVLIAWGVGLLSALLAGDIQGKYALLVKAPLSPPEWLFGIVWPILYTLMGLAAYLIFRKPGDKKMKQKALILYFIQLFLNFIWSILFFGSDLLWVAAIVIVILDIAVIATVICFSKIDKIASYFLWPYLLWILFASYLNITFAIIN